MDGRWSSRRNAKEGTVIFKESGGGIIDIQHCVRIPNKVDGKLTGKNARKGGDLKKTEVRKDDARTFDWLGSSKPMEVSGVDACSARLAARGVVIDAVVHDSDAGTLKKMQKYFPRIKNFLDRNHKKKSLKERVIARKGALRGCVGGDGGVGMGMDGGVFLWLLCCAFMTTCIFMGKILMK